MLSGPPRCRPAEVIALVDEEDLPGKSPVALTPEHIAARKEAEERDRHRWLEWAMILQALDDNSMGVTRAMRQWYPREE
jgi:hypothetical protein